MHGPRHSIIGIQMGEHVELCRTLGSVQNLIQQLAVNIETGAKQKWHHVGSTADRRRNRFSTRLGPFSARRGWVRTSQRSEQCAASNRVNTKWSHLGGYLRRKNKLETQRWRNWRHFHAISGRWSVICRTISWRTGWFGQEENWPMRRASERVTLCKMFTTLANPNVSFFGRESVNVRWSWLQHLRNEKIEWSFRVQSKSHGNIISCNRRERRSVELHDWLRTITRHCTVYFLTSAGLQVTSVYVALQHGAQYLISILTSHCEFPARPKALVNPTEFSGSKWRMKQLSRNVRMDD